MSQPAPIERQPIRQSLESTPAADMLLVAEILKKDRKATAEFVERYADCVAGYVRRRVQPHLESADDLVQEVFLAAWQNLASFRGNSPLRSWLLGIARHKVDDYYRRRLQEATWPEEDDACDEVARYDPQYDRSGDRDRVRQVLANLPEEYCLILLWRYREGHSTREMAGMLTKTEKAVERLLARARAQFRRRWNDVQP